MKSQSISVVIPMYNSENSIVQCLSSVISQSRLDLIGEILIINDGSSDSSEQKVQDFIINNNRKFGITFRLLSQQNNGVSSARNNGIKESSCDWIAFLDSDDEWNNRKIELQSKIIDEYVDVDMVGCNVTHKKQKIGFFKSPYIAKVYYKNMLIRSFPYTSTVLVKKNCIVSSGYFDEQQSHCEDMNLFVKIAKNYSFYHLNEQLVTYGSGKNTIGSTFGLSSNLTLMNEGAKKNIIDFYKQGIISKSECMILMCFNQFKYMRRIFIKKMYGK